MRLTRRGVLAGAPASFVATRLPAATERITLVPGSIDTRIAGRDIPMLGFNGSLPGPTLRFRQGQAVDITLKNRLDDGALVHWHGLRLPNRMDGVNVLTQDVVAPGESFQFRFDVLDAGTFWYHSHYLSYDQVSRGLFGAFIVDEKNPPAVDHDIVVQFFDVLLDQDGNYDEAFRADQFSTVGRIGNVVTTYASVDSVKSGDRLRLRLINPSIDRIYRLRLSGLVGRIVAFDGMPLSEPMELETVLLAPGQRCDVIGDVIGQILFKDVWGPGETDLGEIVVSGARPPTTEPIKPLPPNPTPHEQDPSRSVELVLQGGAGGRPHRGTGTWALNDASGLPRQPFLSVPRGTTVEISVRNETGFPHVMHLHGHHFRERDPSGTLGAFRDSIFLDIGEQRTMIVTLDNPGAWMLHCHMLSHQADGMATWIRVG
ncbi:multicopper oxidase family protein [Maliponia aquimaris]|uniref:Multicopper oxidase mco n=1 Tax=Maliponia aquimaris TaxID=1673631 RepID=A0A238L3W1_9RHOB|nr:multicopper oxidase family protein [Maliponia aquimaris]SMX49709.1 Multicopper oxidase mco [Maliponia aquimaris]